LRALGRARAKGKGMHRRLIIGIGNPDRGDDGVGARVAAKLADEGLRDTEVMARSADVVGLIEDWADAEVVVLIDAAAPVSHPGTIHRVDLTAEVLPRDLSLSSTHSFGILETLELARSLDRLPRRVVLYAVEGTCFEPGSAMSPEVCAAAEEVARQIARC